MIIHIQGVQFRNQGAHLMLLAIRERLARVLPDARIVLAPSPNATYEDRAPLGALQLLPLAWRGLDGNAASGALPAPLRRIGYRYGIVTECEIDAVLDASGFAYGDPWPERLMHYTAGTVRRLARRSRPYVFLPQAFGPFRRPGRARQEFAAALDRAALVCPRDAESRQHLLELAPGLGDRLSVSPDFTLGVAGDPAAAQRRGVGRRTVLLVPNAHMESERNPSAAGRTQYAAMLLALARAARTRGLEVRVLNHGGADDRPLCARLAQSLGDSPIIEEPDPLATKGIIGAAAAVVSSRFHGCVNAMSQAVPCLGTSWSHKYAALFADFGASEWLVTDGDALAAVERFERLLDGHEALAARLAARSAALAREVEAMWARVGTILAGGGHS